MDKARVRDMMQVAFEGIEENVPQDLPGRPGYVVVWRGTKVLVRKARKNDIISKPAGTGG